MSIYSRLKPFGPSGFGYASTAEEVTEGLDLSGKTYLVTGCNSGLGLESMRVLCLRGATVIGAARTLAKAQTAGDSVSGQTVPLACELSEPASVRAAVQTVIDGEHKLDGILCNAGIMMLPSRVVHYGVEMQFFTNHIGHFMLVTGLLDQLTDTGRVVAVSSYGHTLTYRDGMRLDDLDAAGGYGATTAYGQSKLANVLFANHLATLLKPGQTANSLHPGTIATNLARHLPAAVIAIFGAVGNVLANKTIPQGAATSLYVLTHPTNASVSGRYFADVNEHPTSAYGADADLARRLWVKSEEIVAGLP